MIKKTDSRSAVKTACKALRLFNGLDVYGLPPDRYRKACELQMLLESDLKNWGADK